MEPKLVRITEAAQFLGIHPNTLRRQCNKGKIRYRTMSGNQRLFDLSDMSKIKASFKKEKNMEQKKEIQTEDHLSKFMKAWAAIAGIDLSKGFAVSMTPKVSCNGMIPVGTIMVLDDINSAGPPCPGFRQN